MPSRFLMSTLLLSVATGCGALAGMMPGSGANYVLQTDRAAKANFGPIVSCAGEAGFQSTQDEDAVNVLLGDGAAVSYVDRTTSFDMLVTVGASVPEAERADKMSAAKKKGDEIWACAKEKPAGAVMASTAPADTVSGVANMTWAGTWNAQVEYEVSCDFGLGNVQKGSQKHFVSLVITGDNASLVGTPATPKSGWMPMKGTGDNSQMTLIGPFPFRDHSGEPVANSNNSGTLVITTVTSAKKASGTFEGSSQNQFGGRCKVQNGTVTVMR